MRHCCLSILCTCMQATPAPRFWRFGMQGAQHDAKRRKLVLDGVQDNTTLWSQASVLLVYSLCTSKSTAGGMHVLSMHREKVSWCEDFHASVLQSHHHLGWCCISQHMHGIQHARHQHKREQVSAYELARHWQQPRFTIVMVVHFMSQGTAAVCMAPSNNIRNGWHACKRPAAAACYHL